jgi:hypothetical protein
LRIRTGKALIAIIGHVVFDIRGIDITSTGLAFPLWNMDELIELPRAYLFHKASCSFVIFT